MANEYPETRGFVFIMGLFGAVTILCLIAVFFLSLSMCSFQSDHVDEITYCQGDLKDAMNMYAKMREGRAVAVNLASYLAGVAHRELSENPELQDVFRHIQRLRDNLQEIQTNMLNPVDNEFEESKDYEE